MTRPKVRPKFWTLSHSSEHKKRRNNLTTKEPGLNIAGRRPTSTDDHHVCYNPPWFHSDPKLLFDQLIVMIKFQVIPPIVTSTPMETTRNRAKRWTVLFFISWPNLSSCWNSSVLLSTTSPARFRHSVNLTIHVSFKALNFWLRGWQGPVRLIERTVLRC